VYKSYDEFLTTCRSQLAASSEDYGELLDEKFELKEELP